MGLSISQREYDLGEKEPDRLGSRPSERLFGLWVPLGNTTAIVNDNDCIQGIVYNGSGSFLAFTRLATGVFVDPPVHQQGRAFCQNEQPMNGGPSPRMMLGCRMVVYQDRYQHAHDPMVPHDQNECDEKRDPVLVKHNDRQQYKEVEMHLDDASRQMHEQGCGYHQSDGCHGGPCVPAQNCETADAGNCRNG